VVLADRIRPAIFLLVLTTVGGVITCRALGAEEALQTAQPSREEGTASGAPKPGAAGRRATCFTFRKTGRLIARPEAMPKPGPYHPTLVNMDGVDRFPYDYALYFSTDHHRGRGGIWLYVCSGIPTEAGHWKSYDRAVADGEFDHLEDKPAANPIFVDTRQGRQTETPHANVIAGRVYMTYHNAGAGHSQSTLLATSTDGVRFQRIHGAADSIVLDYDPATAPGNGHTGYFRWGPNPFSAVSQRYIGYSLHGGGDYCHDAMWASSDAVRWDKRKVFDRTVGYAVEAGRAIRRHDVDPHSISQFGNGEYVAICTGGTISSGGRARTNEMYEIFLSGDGTTLTRESRKILANGPPGSDDEEELSQPTTVVIGDTWHLLYVGTKGHAGVNAVMGATGTLDRSAPRPARLKPRRMEP